MPNWAQLAALGIDDGLDQRQFVAMKVAEAWEVYQEVVSDDPEPTADIVPWSAYKRGAEKVAHALWSRKQRRDKKRPDRTSLESLRNEPAARQPDPGPAEVDVRDSVDALGDELADIVRLRLEGCSVAAVAAETKLSERSVKRRLLVARGLLTPEL